MNSHLSGLSLVVLENARNLDEKYAKSLVTGTYYLKVFSETVASFWTLIDRNSIGIILFLHQNHWTEGRGCL